MIGRSRLRGHLRPSTKFFARTFILHALEKPFADHYYIPPAVRALDRRSTLSSSSCSLRLSALSRFCWSTSCLCASAALSSLLSASLILSLQRRLLVYIKAVRPRSSLACRSAFPPIPIKSCSSFFGGRKTGVGKVGLESCMNAGTLDNKGLGSCEELFSPTPAVHVYHYSEQRADLQ